MSVTFKMLKNNQPEVMALYKTAITLWDELLISYIGDAPTLAKELQFKQLEFERIVEKYPDLDRWDGQEIMVFSGLYYFLDSEDETDRYLASSIADAFALSYCSIEVKGLAKRVASLFFLEGS